MTKKKRGGFTIIELLIVVIVIGILAAAGLAKYQNFAETSRRKTCLAQLQQIEVAMAIWETNNSAFAENAKTAFAFTPRTGRLASPSHFSLDNSAPGAWAVNTANVLSGGATVGAITDGNQTTVGGPTNFFNAGAAASPTAGPLGTIIRDDNVWKCPSAMSRFYNGEPANVPDDYFDTSGSGLSGHVAGSLAIGEHGRYVFVIAGTGNTTSGTSRLNNKGFPNDLISDSDGAGNTSNAAPCPQVPFKVCICGCYGKFGQANLGTPNVPGTSALNQGGAVGPDGSALNRHSSRW